ncbi:MAG: hypothetical protein WBF67_10060 [Olleya sp.]
MKKIITLIFGLLITSHVFSQQQALKITNQTSNKVITIKENKRVKITTASGEKLSGRFTINNDSIVIDNRQIALQDITDIKRNPLLVSIVTNGLLIYGGALTIGIGTIIGVFANTNGFLLAIPGAAMVTTGILSPNFNRKFKTEKNWTLQIISL